MQPPGMPGIDVKTGVSGSVVEVGDGVGLVRLAVAEEQYARFRSLSSPTQAVNVQEHETSGVPALMQALYAFWQASCRALSVGAATATADRAKVRAAPLESIVIDMGEVEVLEEDNRDTKNLL